MRLRGRIERLEKKMRALTKSGPCPRCGGGGMFAVRIGTDDPDPPGCERCGKLQFVRIFEAEAPSYSAVDRPRGPDARSQAAPRG